MLNMETVFVWIMYNSDWENIHPAQTWAPRKNIRESTFLVTVFNVLSFYFHQSLISLCQYQTFLAPTECHYHVY
jgi:hypothetical protein